MISLSKSTRQHFFVYHFLFFLEIPVGIRTLHTNEKEVNFIVVFAGCAVLGRFFFSFQSAAEVQGFLPFSTLSPPMQCCSLYRAAGWHLSFQPTRGNCTSNSLTRSKVSGGGRKCLQRGLSEANPHLTRISMTRDNAAGREHRSQPSHT